MSENQDFYKLINDKTKVPRLTPVPQIDCSKNDYLEKNPLQKFRAHALKIVKSRPPQQKASDRWKSSVHRISKTFYAEQLIKLARTIHVQGLLPEWEENILKLIPKTSKRKHVLFLMTTMKEVKQDYLKEMQNLSVKNIVNTEDSDTSEKVFQSEFHRRTSNEDFSSSFRENRKIILKRYHLSHRLLRSISNIMFYNLPKNLINFERYKKFEELHISKLSELMNNDLQRSSSIVQNKCYNEIIRYMLQMNHLKNDRRLPKLLHCAESFMVQQILNSMMNSINNLIEILSSSGSCAHLKLELLCRNDKLELEPSIKDIYNVYHTMIDNVSNIVQDLVPLGEWLKINKKTDYIKVKLPEWFLEKAHEDLDKVLENNFKSLSEHYKFISDRFSFLCSSVTKKQIMKLIYKKKNFEVYCLEVDKFNAYLVEVNNMVPNVYYNFGTLNQTSAIVDLKQNTSEIVNILIKELILNHQELNRSICYEFESLESRALAIPDDTKSLFELTDYVTHASKVLVIELEKKIEKSVKMLSSLLQIAILSNKHIELNKTTINWLELIKPVFSQHNIFCEAKKGELEDELQKKVTILNAEIDKIFPELVIINDMDDAKRVFEYKEFLALILKKIQVIDNQIEGINTEEKLFKFQETTFPKVDEVKEVMSSFCSLVHIIYQWQKDYEVWMDGPFEYLKSEIIENKTKNYFEKITEMHKSFKIRIKSDLTSNKPFKFTGAPDDPEPLQQPAPLKLCWQALKNLNEFKQYVPLSVCMCNPALEKRHWDEMSTIAGTNLLPNAGTTLRKIISMNLLKDFEKYEIISIGANKELFLQQKLTAMIDEWNNVSFSMFLDEVSELSTLSNADLIDTLYEEQLVEITKMRSSYFITPIEEEVIDFQKELCCVRDTIECWNSVQDQCKYLKSFLFNEVVQNNLETEVDLYNSLKIILKSIEQNILVSPTFKFFSKSSNAIDKLKQGKYALELINSKVHDFLEQLRLSFTRLFFLSDSEIKKLLFEFQNFTKKNSHLRKCFSNVERVKMDDKSNILSIIGEGGEEVQLISKISILPQSRSSKSVTDWLINLNNEIINVIKQKIHDSVETIDDEITLQWISNTPAIVIFCAWQVLWTSQIHSCFLSPYSEDLKECRNRTKLHKDKALQLLKLNLSRKDRDIVTSLIIFLMHQEEVTSLLIEKKIHEDSDFDWKAQFRYYYLDDRIKVMIINTCIDYGYEYYSSGQHMIVNTPLTERCYRSLMEAYHHNYFGTVVGLSSVGKTETIQNLSRILAFPFFMFCGSDELDYNYLSRIFKGLVSTGAWVYFKNFVRVDEGILSVIAQYIFRISQSKAMSLNSINIDGVQLSFNPSSYIIFSVNPTSSKFYPLPENLKIHFRTVCFISPDVEKICQVELLAAGFDEAKNLATLLTEVYNFCNDQLSSRIKYNFKLRNLKTIIATSAKLKFSYPNEEESVLIFRSLIDLNISQLFESDILMFQQILNSAFSELVLPPPNYDNLLSAVEKICTDEHLTDHDALKLKTIQLYEMIYLKKEIILVGDSLSGKSTYLMVLRKALLLLHENDNQTDDFQIDYEIICPGSICADKLYGSQDQVSGIWNDGICSNIIRRFAEDNKTVSKWLIFDGKLCSTWIEKLETIISKEKILFLSSNERIVLTQDTHIFFETLDLKDVSPSIVSQCGIVYVELQSIGWKPLLLSQILNAEKFKNYEKLVFALFEWLMNPCLQFLRDHCKSSLDLTDAHLVVSALELFKMYIQSAIEENIVDKKEKDAKDHMIIWSQAAIMMATNWVFTGSLDLESKQLFEEFFISLWNKTNDKYPRPVEIKQFDISLPSEGKLQDNIYIFKGIGFWKYCGEILKAEKIKEDALFREPFIPTIDSIKFFQLFNLHTKYRKSFVLSGESSAGKTTLLQDYLTNLPESEYITNYFHFNSISKADRAQELFLLKLNKINRYNFRGSNNKYCVNVIDDLHVASKKNCFENSTMELIRQHMNYGFWYDSKQLKQIAVSETMFTGSLTTNKEKLKICSRFIRHFNVYTMQSQSKENIFRIFSNALSIDLKKNFSSTDVSSSVNSIINATVDLYTATFTYLRPTPTKFLYRFSLNDIYRITKGCGLIQKESVETKVTFLRLWAHEAFRVIGDRITDTEDAQWLFSKIREYAKLHFKDPFESAFDNLPKFENNEITQESFKNLFFSNLMELDVNKRKYEEISSAEQLKNKLLLYIKEHNETSKKRIEIVITCHAIQHLIRICRILTIPGGNLLMASSSGSGRKSLTRLAAFIQQQSFYEPKIHAKYDESSWKEDIKLIMQECGTLKKNYTFSITDRQLRSEIIQDIDSLLSFGDIPRLFSKDEEREIIKMVRIDAQKGSRNMEMEMSNIFQYFLDQCRQKIHFIINVSPIKNNLLKYLRKYSSLIDKCTVNWFDYWPDEAFEQVATYYLKDVDMLESARTKIIKTSKYFYDNIQQVKIQYYEETGKVFQIMPLSFIQTMKIYKDMISKKQEEITVTRKRYLNGLDKLQLAAREVAEMKNALTKLRPQLEASARQTELTMKEIETENISVERATVLVKRDEEIANKKAEIAGVLKAECEAELAVAIPILEDALAALNTLKPTDVTLVKSMKNPPDTIKLTLAAVCVMLNIPAEKVVDSITGKKSMDYWGPSKRILGDMNFLQNLKDYDKDNISPAVMATIKKTYMPDKSFMPHIVAKASSAAEGLCKWVRAMVSYDEVAKVVAPKKEKLAAAQKECDETEAFLNAKRKTLADLNLKLAALKSTLEATLFKKLELEREVEMCTIKLNKAENLIASLGGEKTRWMDSSNKLGRYHDNLPGDVLLSSVMITYLSPVSLTYREKQISEWKEYMKTCSVPFSQEFDFINFLGNEIKINSWYLCGLSNNQFSLQNALIMENSPLWCLFIDPQAQANQWLKNLEKSNNLQVVKFSKYTNYMEIIRKNVEIGNPVLLENLEDEIDVFVDPILIRDIYKISENWFMDFGLEKVSYKSNFRFYLTTRYNNPSYSVDIFNKVTVIDFLLPSDALRDRLLDLVISREKPELQEKFEKVLVENINTKKILKQQEDNILYTLSASTSNILEDEAAIKILDSSKSLAIDLKKRQEASRITKEEIEAFRDTFSQFTKYCADLYSTLNILPNLNHMYRFSLSWFTQLYIKSIETSNRSVIHKKRIDYLKLSSIQNLHQSIHNALLEKHKLLYSFILCVKTVLDTEQVTEQEFNVFMSINDNPNYKFENESLPNPASYWLTDETWREICKVSTNLTVFQNFSHSLTTNNLRWKKYYMSSEGDDCTMPSPWDHKLTQFQKLIVTRILCPDKIIFKITEFVESVIGISNNFIPCNITRPYAESSCLIPLIFILPSYSSPFAIVNKFAKTLGYSSKLHVLSMGPSQEQKAELLIELARKNGEWIFLHNCHLALPWTMKLEKMVEDFDVSNTHLGFRLWISTQENKKFPISLLQNSIKIAFDSPHDIKQTLTWSYRSEPIRDKDFFEGCPGKDKAFIRLLYAFCLFHAVTRERKNFGIQSWNFQYNFDESDLQVSIIQLKNWINQCEKVPFKALTYFLSECNYGGKMMDIQDKIYLDTLALDYCNSRVINDSNYDFDSVNTYRVPKRIEYRDYLKHIKNSIPAYTSPEDFCFDKNVAIMKTSNKVKDFLYSLSCLNEATVIKDVKNRNNQLKSIIFEILEIIPENFNMKEVEEKYQDFESEPLNYVLIEEITTYNQCLSTIRNSLLELQRAYDGFSVWTEKLEEMSEDISQGLVPKTWKTHITLLTKKQLPKFTSDLVERVKFINDWITNGHPQFYWFGGLMSCQRFLSIKKMTFAKINQVPIDQVAFEFNVLDFKSPVDDFDVPENSFCIYGLYLVGASWNEQTKSLGNPKTKIFYNDMPMICFELTLKKNINSVNMYKCPLYVCPILHNSPCNSKTQFDNHILSINLKSDVNPKIWIKRGTALYCQNE